MALVETVRGPVETGRLGSTLMHEHVFELGYVDRMVLSHDTLCHSDRYAIVREQFPDWGLRAPLR